MHATDLYGFNQRHHEDLSITEIAVIARFGDRLNRLDRAFKKVVIDGNLQHDLSKQRGLVFDAAIHFCLTPLTTVTMGIAERNPFHVDLGECFLNGSELGRLNNRDHQLHGFVLA